MRGSRVASSSVRRRSFARERIASSSRPHKTRKRGDGGRKKHPKQSNMPGRNWSARGILQEADPETASQIDQTKPNIMHRTHRYG